MKECNETKLGIVMYICTSIHVFKYDARRDSSMTKTVTYFALLDLRKTLRSNKYTAGLLKFFTQALKLFSAQALKQ